MKRSVVKSSVLAVLSIFLLQGCTSSAGDTDAGYAHDGHAADQDNGTGDVHSTRPVELAIEIHVEGWKNEASDPQAFTAHSEAVDVVASAASAHGAILLLGLSATYAKAAARYGTSYIDRWIGMGHRISYHADVGGTSQPSLEQLVSDLENYKQTVDALGVETVKVASGICSRGPWVDASIAAGFELACGIVEYCLTSLDPANLPPDKQDVANCAGPADCHGQALNDLSKALHPWFASDSSNWLEPDPDGRLAILVSMGGIVVPCIAEGETQSGCTADDGDVAAFAAEIEQASLYTESPAPTVLVHSWSIGSRVKQAFAEAFFAAADEAVSAGRARWIDLGELPARIPR